MRRTAALIAGGGPAGAAAAILLAHGGAMPVLIERQAEPHDVVCGGFLAADAIAMLARIGIDVFALGAHPIGRTRIVAGRRRAEAALPFAAAGLSRNRLDAALLQAATDQGAAIERGVAIRRVDPATRCLDLADGARIGGEALFLATGKHDLRGHPRAAPLDADPALGLRVRLRPSPALAAALADTIELHLFRGGYAGLLVQEDGGANLCLSVAQSRLKAAGGQPDRLIALLEREAPLLAERFGAAVETGPWSSIARVPYGWRATQAAPGLFRLGDQAAVIASLAGDGIAIALASAVRATHAFLHDGPDAAAAFQADIARRTRRPIALANLLRHWGETPWIAGPLAGLLGHVPGLLRQAAAMTRVGAGQSCASNRSSAS
ncbi:monooxygenase, FAD-binding [Rhizorhabdus wittichii RW1]|uniref:Monooxygenase, FAD-binding n=1 Tax=Rhizorhabdus wittichii (strain DSM 6014 / CCUG 31198 / JCM 15750 / NBRC 105917 / EY 4224 / RW1) TaxID=392499 RepID=A0A9J9HA22_RHIWR|nr:monooxygenase, FAD-binding [Rhizorhabdus wittichii RW1]